MIKTFFVIGFFATANALANTCPSTQKDMDAHIVKTMPQATFSFTSQPKDKSVLKLCEVLQTQTQQCSYRLENGFELSYQLGSSYHCFNGVPPAATVPASAVLTSSGMVQVGSELNSITFGDANLAKDAFTALSARSDVKKDTTKSPEKDGTYRLVDVINFDLSPRNILRSTRLVNYRDGQADKEIYFLQVRKK